MEAKETVLLVLAAQDVKTFAVDSRKREIEVLDGDDSHSSCSRSRCGRTRTWKAWIPESVHMTLWRLFSILGAMTLSEVFTLVVTLGRVQEEITMSW